MNSKVKVESYQLRVSNASDEARVYDIICTLNVSDNKVTGVENGQTMKDGVYIADFNRSSDNNFQVTFHGVSNDKMCEVTNAINDFIAEATTAQTTAE